LVSLGINVFHDGYERGLERLTVRDDELVILFVSPPWGEALDREVGLDLRRTTPPVVEIIDLATAVFHPHKLLVGIQAYETVNSDSLAEVTARLESSTLNVYDVDPQAQKPGLLLGVGWLDRLIPSRPRLGANSQPPRDR
jgi:hypothetical protein